MPMGIAVSSLVIMVFLVLNTALASPVIAVIVALLSGVFFYTGVWALAKAISAHISG